MKKILIGLIALGSISAFAESKVLCTVSVEFKKDVVTIPYRISYVGGAETATETVEECRIRAQSWKSDVSSEDSLAQNTSAITLKYKNGKELVIERLSLNP
jgi:hypothetical protein